MGARRPALSAAARRHGARHPGLRPHLISDPSVTDDEYHERTTRYDLEQFKALGRRTQFLYTEARAALTATGQLGKLPATPIGPRTNTSAATPTGGISNAINGSWSDEFHQHAWFLAARSAMAARIRRYDLSLINDPDVSDEEFDARSTEFGYQQTRQLLLDTINTLRTGVQPA
ncbi:MAG TPA: hypothetical protein VFC19_29695 [Candidatus Limnocylindrales bacterium]|nr:hypothetical protein [Candidatus Limnocylindrales bacterium]